MIELKSTAGNVRLTTPTIIAGGGGSIDLSNYYTKAEVDAKIPDVSGFALKTEIPDVSVYQTETQVIALIQANMPVSGDEVSY